MPFVGIICKPSKESMKQIVVLLVALLMLSNCSTNPATGQRQFTGLMSLEQELAIGAQEHEKIVKQYGLYEDEALNAYVSGIGARVSAKTERPEITYKFYIIDSPIVNAFALPGGYIYVSRGLLALANSEAELAGVLSHEVGHITGRHSAERYSHGVVTQLGAGILSTVLGSPAASQALGLGSNLFLSSYSRSQENEADALGVRYMSQGGFKPEAMTEFLKSMDQESKLTLAKQGKKEAGASYFSTHPPTPERIEKTREIAQNYQEGNKALGRDLYLKMVDGLPFGERVDQGVVMKGRFYHRDMRFAFDVPDGFYLVNQPSQVVMKDRSSNALMVFDFAKSKEKSPYDYLAREWMADQNLFALERIKVGGMEAATGSFKGAVNNQKMTIQLIAIDWGDGRFARYQIALPTNVSMNVLNKIKSASYSFERLSKQQAATIRGKKITLTVASFGQSVEDIAKRQSIEEYSESTFRVLNGLDERGGLKTGQPYKIIVQD